MLNTAWIVMVSVLGAPAGDVDNWPQFRGPRGDGHTSITHLPLKWSEKDSVTWKLKKNMPQRASLMLVKDLIFAVSHKGYVVCVDTATGKPVWTERIGKAYSASPIHAENRVYLFSERAGTTVIEPGRKYKPLAANKLDGRVMASPAVAGKALFIRTDTHLYRIEKKTP